METDASFKADALAYVASTALLPPPPQGGSFAPFNRASFPRLAGPIPTSNPSPSASRKRGRPTPKGSSGGRIGPGMTGGLGPSAAAEALASGKPKRPRNTDRTSRAQCHARAREQYAKYVGTAAGVVEGGEGGASASGAGPGAAVEAATTAAAAGGEGVGGAGGGAGGGADESVTTSSTTTSSATTTPGPTPPTSGDVMDVEGGVLESDKPSTALAPALPLPPPPPARIPVVGGIQVLNFGTIDPQPGYHSRAQVWPRGFSCIQHRELHPGESSSAQNQHLSGNRR